MFPFHLLPYPVHPTRFSLCFFPGFLAIFILLSSRQQQFSISKIFWMPNICSVSGMKVRDELHLEIHRVHMLFESRKKLNIYLMPAFISKHTDLFYFSWIMPLELLCLPIYVKQRSFWIKDYHNNFCRRNKVQQIISHELSLPIYLAQIVSNK